MTGYDHPTMKTDITPEQVTAYRRDGFVYHPGFLTPDEVAELKTAVFEAVATMGKKKVAGGGIEWDEGDAFYDRVFTQRLNLWRISPTVKRYMLSPLLGKAMCQLSGVSGYRVWHDQALVKEPFANPTAWHLDNPYWSFYSPQAISIWIALEDATLANGCLFFIPGTHRLARYDRNVGIGQNMDELFRLNPDLTGADPVAVPMHAGDCSFHNGLTAHGAGANMTRRRRSAMTCAYMPVGSTFNGQRNILPESYFAKLQKGDVLDNDDWNPVL